MPAAWSPKDERQYKHIVASCRRKRGAATCKRIAAATVNKQRRTEGRTLSGLDWKKWVYSPWYVPTLVAGLFVLGKVVRPKYATGLLQPEVLPNPYTSPPAPPVLPNPYLQPPLQPTVLPNPYK